MAATRLIALHKNRGRSIAQCLEARTDYAKNPEKTEKGNLVTSYACDPITVDEEFLLQKRQYLHITGKSPQHDIIAYQIRQSFKPGEITPEEANRIGFELAMRFTKGYYSFIVATHTDRSHIHNHIVYNSTSIDGTRKFKNIWLSGRSLQRLSDLICLENGLSVIEPAPYSGRAKRTTYPKHESARTLICRDIDKILEKRPKDFLSFLKGLEDAGYEIKQGKNIAVRSRSQKRFIRFSSLGAGYSESSIREFISGKRTHSFKSQRNAGSEKHVDLLIDIQKKLQEKGAGYARWATVYNLKQMSKSMLLLRDHGVKTLDQLSAKIEATVKRRDDLHSSIQKDENRLTELAALKKHIVNYSKTRHAYEEYRKSGYSKKFLDNHREEISLHKAAKQAFDELGVSKIPRVKELSAEYAEILTAKKQAYEEYRKTRDEARELLIAKRNIESLFEAEKQDEHRSRIIEKVR